MGDTGVKGDTGIAGPTGAYGGPQGDTGVQGDTGAQGYQGVTGPIIPGSISNEPQNWISGSMYQMLFTDNKIQCINPSVVNILRLPTTVGILAGDLIYVINRSSNNLTIQSSSGDAIDIINTGYIKCRALISSPVNSSDWYIEDVFEKISLAFTINSTGSCFANTQNITMKIVRNNKNLTYYIPRTIDTANATISSSFTSSTGFIPARFIPDGTIGSGSDLTEWWNSPALNRVSGGNIVYTGDTTVQISLSGYLRFSASSVWAISSSNGFPAYILSAYKE